MIDRTSVLWGPLVVFAILCAVYAPTASWGFPYPIDPLANNISGWHLGKEGLLHWRGFDDVRIREGDRNSWIVESRFGATSQYPPGMTLVLAPAYWAAGSPELTPVSMVSRYRSGTAGPSFEIPLPNLWPGTLVAVIATALALAVMAYATEGLVSGSVQVRGAVIGGVGTSAWAVASTAPFQHGPAMLCVAVTLAASARSRWFVAATAMAMAVAIRPPLILIVLAVTAAVALKDRALKPLVASIGALVGLGGVVAYNRWLFGEWSVSGGYGGAFAQNVASGDIAGYLLNIAGGLFDPFRGVLIASPFLLLLVPGIRTAARRAPSWAIGGAVGASVYLLFTWKANRFSGGDGHWSYRYPLEALMAAGPILLISYERWTAAAPIRVKLFRFGAAAAVTLQFIGAIR